MSDQVLRCSVPECAVQTTNPNAKHLYEKHYRCSCGWIGTQFKMHVVSCTRYRPERSHLVTETCEPKVGEWQAVAAPTVPGGAQPEEDGND